MYTFMSLKLHTADLDIIDSTLADKVQQAPGFFKDTPVVVDLTILDEQDNVDLNAAELLDCIRRHQLVPIVASVRNKSSPLASSIAIPLIESSAGRKKSTQSRSTSASAGSSANNSGAKNSVSGAADDETRAETAADAVTGADAATDDSALAGSEVEYVIKAPTFINRPVRSGQQIYARDTDLIIMGSVGPGAEVIADNNIHVYGPLRGRALCGVSGNTDTRIFCQSLEAELVSVAGNFRLLEEVPEDLRGKPAQIWLDNDKLNIEPL
jgi:septum site-determining protein MinC